MKYFYLIILALAAIAACQADNEEENLPSDEVNIEAECSTDADCAAAGCSGQICTTATKAADIITTCEYRDEYSCLQYTNCGCTEGKCNWAQNTEYDACLANYK